MSKIVATLLNRDANIRILFEFSKFANMLKYNKVTNFIIVKS